jgi:hypothetical protein
LLSLIAAYSLHSFDFRSSINQHFSIEKWYHGSAAGMRWGVIVVSWFSVFMRNFKAIL